MPAGSSRGERLDPFALPLRFEAADYAADERMRPVELTASAWSCAARCAASRWRSICRSPPISASRSAWSRRRSTTPGRRRHRARTSATPSLSLALYRAADGTDIVAEWQLWGRVLSCRCWSPKPTAACASRSSGSGAIDVGPPDPRGGDGIRRSTGAAADRSPLRRHTRRLAGVPSCIAASARSSRAVELTSPESDGISACRFIALDRQSPSFRRARQKRVHARLTTRYAREPGIHNHGL